MYFVIYLPKDVMPGLAKDLSASAVVTDMSPLRDPQRWVHEVATELNKAGQNMPLFQVEISASKGLFV